MNWIAAALGQRRMVVSLVVLLSLAGVASWLTMVRQEDPAFPYRYGYVLVRFPGADVATVEHLVAEPLEEEISEVEQVDEIRTTVRAGFLHAVIGMKQTVYDTETAWERIRVAVSRAEARFPDGVEPPVIDDRQVDSSTVVLAVGGSDDLVELQSAAERLKLRVYGLDEVARVRLYGDSGEQVTIALDDARLNTLGVTPGQIMAQLRSRNEIVTAGYVEAAGRQTLVRPQTEFRSVEEIRRTPIVLGDGRAIPLEAVADVRFEVADPEVETAWVNGERVVVVAVTIARNTVNVVQFGERIEAWLDEVRPEFAPLTIETMMFQPRRVDERLAELGRSLLLGVVIVALVLLVFMGARLGFIVAAVLPLVTMSSIALLAMGGGVLHQMAVAGMVIALGMLVDNAIVMIENIQWHIDRGASRVEAAVRSVRELARPLGAATGTTLAVFVPMLIAKGDTADFTRAVPAVIVLMLTISYLFALFVTPLLGERLLVPRTRSGERTRMARFGARVGRLAVQRGAWVVALAVLLVGAAALGSRYVDRDFFPPTDRNQMVVDVYYPEGTPIDVTTDFVRAFADEVSTRPAVRDVYAFTGSSGPRFFYNLNENPRAPQIGRVVVETRAMEDLQGVLDWVAAQAETRWPGVQIVARRLAQGPPAPAPVELRLIGNDRTELARHAEAVTRLLREIPGTEYVRHDLGIGIPSLRFDIDDALAGSRGLARNDVAAALAMQTQGLVVGSYRAADDPLPIRLRSPEGSAFSLEQLLAVNAYTPGGEGIPVLDTGTATLEWQPAVIHRWDLQNAVTVYSEVADGTTYDTVFAELERRLPELDIPANVRIVPGGLQESSGEANTALYRSLPIGLILLLFFLLLQFNSFRRVGIVLVTVPLALAGVVPGLLLTGNPFGFMALLGVIALVGIVVNNAIVLIDVIDSNLAAGADIGEAVIEAVARRARPILLTTATTVAGLTPLTLSSSTLWPPMAWSIISGLIASTVLTLGVVPTLSYWLLRPRAGKARA